MAIHICRRVSKHCRNFEASFGEVCVGCNQCGRFSQNRNALGQFIHQRRGRKTKREVLKWQS